MNTLAQVAAHMPYDGWGGGPGWFIIFPILWFLLVVAIVVLIARSARRGFRQGPPWARQAGTDPVAILGERYARGEIDESEYRSRLAVLRSAADPGGGRS
ncbi:SHOCT domain-containing protein [Myceligenerans pegani]|uniref:SHOCT domain-containing protein n=1 Tax=Myceligenerans pegani TaxID=2776917 RepID=A0ABR9N2U0_9MICO|nr:SHOCT domain-containing protein [Myceligenerans sp. TRM 65318]MBE1877969.1 SHOCT domain-containing protein [Myceligenerans sp. TRM 65318]MBE3020240.1 SHOCT domain-containing protein [Myceligenerans sp. TRM 65318]